LVVLLQRYIHEKSHHFLATQCCLLSFCWVFRLEQMPASIRNSYRVCCALPPAPSLRHLKQALGRNCPSSGSPLNACHDQAFDDGRHAASVAIPGRFDSGIELVFTHNVSWRPAAGYKGDLVRSIIFSSSHSFSHFDSSFFSHSFTLH
jgi:hypothetical protein